MSTRWFAALPSGTARVSHEAPKSSPVATPWWAAARLFINGVLICFDLHQLGMLIHWVPKCPQSWAQQAQPQSVRCASNNFHKDRPLPWLLNQNSWMLEEILSHWVLTYSRSQNHVTFHCCWLTLKTFAVETPRFAPWTRGSLGNFLLKKGTQNHQAIKN